MNEPIKRMKMTISNCFVGCSTGFCISNVDVRASTHTFTHTSGQTISRLSLSNTHTQIIVICISSMGLVHVLSLIFIFVVVARLFNSKPKGKHTPFQLLLSVLSYSVSCFIYKWLFLLQFNASNLSVHHHLISIDSLESAIV